MAKSTIIPVPEKFKVFYDREKMVIRRKWFGPQVFFLIPFIIFWDGFMVFWFYKAISNEQWMMAAFGSIHGLVGLGMTYFLICCFVNTTDVSVDPRNLEVKIQPFPWPGSKKLSSREITQLYCEEKVTHNKNGTSISYLVKVIDQNGKSTKLIGALKDASEAKFIENKVESILGIQNQAVAGEI